MEAVEPSPEAGAPGIPVAPPPLPPPIPLRPVRAPLSPEALAKMRSRHEREERDGRVLKTLLWAFGVMMASNVILYWCVSPAKRSGAPVDGIFADIALLVAEIFDAAIIGVTWWKLRRDLPATHASPMPGIRRIAAYVPGALAGLLLLNYGYHAVLRGIFGIHSETVRHTGEHFGFGFTVLTVCILPAFFEELFFRKICHDFFLTVTGPWVAAIASAVMFAAAHTFGLVSFPYLVIFGLFAARLRMRTGSLVAPMVMHFCHNLVLSLYELVRNAQF